MTLEELKKFEEIADKAIPENEFDHKAVPFRNELRLALTPEVAKRLIKLARIGIAAEGLAGALENLITIKVNGYTFKSEVAEEALKQYREMMGEL